MDRGAEVHHRRPSSSADRAVNVDANANYHNAPSSFLCHRDLSQEEMISFVCK
jgi:hypothetical protein